MINLIYKSFLRPFRWYAVLFACLFFGTLQHASAWQKKRDALKYDTSQLQVRSMSSDNIKAYKADEDFNYSTERSQGNSIWDRFWNWVFRNIGKIQANKAWAKFFEVLLWIFCISAFIYAALRIAGMNRIALFSNDKKNDQLEYMLEQDDIYAINFPEAIQLAIEQKNFRLATRLLYLQTLRKLTDAERINWKISKTNDVYLHELSETNYYAGFGFLTRAYEYAWYGEMPLDEPVFRNIQQEFLTFNTSILS